MAAGGFFNSLEAVLGGLTATDSLAARIQADDSTPESFLLNNVMFPRSPTLLSTDYIMSETEGSGRFPTGNSVVRILEPKEAKKFICSKTQIGPSERVMAMDILTPKASYTGFNANRVSLFINSLPPIVANNLVPYVEVEFEMPAKQSGNSFKPFGLNRFFLGDSDPTGFDLGHQAARLGVSKTPKGDTIYTAYAGMELFTSPSTLYSKPESNGYKIKPILNPYAPLAVINSFEVSVASSGQGQGFNQLSKGTLTMTILDRSRLREFGELFQISQYGKATVWITYGWRCKVLSAGDPFAEFINSCMLNRQSFTITQPGYSFENNMVKVSMTLGSKTFDELNGMTLADAYLGTGFKSNYGVSETWKKIRVPGSKQTYEGMIVLLNELKEKLSANVSDVDALGAGSLIPAMNTTPQPEAADPTIKEKIKNLADALKKAADKKYNQKPGANAKVKKASGQDKKALQDANKSIDELAKSLSEYYRVNSSKDSKKNGKYVQYLENLDRSTDAAKKLLEDISNVEYDPYNSKWRDRAAQQNWNPNSKHKSLPSERSKGGNTPKQGAARLNPTYISLGVILLKVLGTAALAQDRIGDVQFVFYKMNSHTAGASDLLLSEFPIDMERLRGEYAREVAKNGGVPLSMGVFLSLLTSQVNDVRSEIYGLKKYFKPIAKDGPPDQAVTKDEWKDNLPQEVKSFVQPYVGIDVQVAERTSAPSNSGATIDLLQSLSVSAKLRKQAAGVYPLVMRIHVYDNNHVTVSNIKTPSPPFGSEAPDDAKLREQAADMLAAKVGPGRISLDKTSKGVYEYTFKDATAFDDLISSYMPSIIIGANGSTIITAAVNTKMNQLMQTAALVGNSPGMSSTGAPSIVSPSGLPYVIIPAEVNITMLGCPLVRFGQTFYINFNTSTTLDGDYYVGTLSHGFSPGKYTTTMKLAPRSGAASFASGKNIVDQLKNIEKYLGLSTPTG